jgi:membrane-associated protein
VPVLHEGHHIAVVHGISHRSREVSDNLALGFRRGPENCAHLAVLHCNVGRDPGHALYSRPNSFFFRREHLISTHEFYERHGGKTIILAQFMPIVRTFAPVVAGAADMTYRRFAMFNVVGAIFWITSMSLTGYFLGLAVGQETLQKNLHLVVGAVIFLSLLPAIIAWLKSKLASRAAR